MTDFCCIVEPKETMEEMKVELNQLHSKISELNAKVKEQDEDLSAAQKEMSKLQEENARLARDLKESEEKCNAVQESLDLAEQKLAEFSQKPEAVVEESLAQSNKSNDGINSLPDEIILEVFGYLKQNQLVQIARVCKRWSVLAKSPVLWKRVNVNLSLIPRCQTTVAKSFINRLPSCVTSIRFDFEEYENWIGPFDFAELCVKLQEKCPHLEEFILTDTELSHSLPSVIDLCTQFLLCVNKLAFHRCKFLGYSAKLEFSGTSKIEVLDLFSCEFRDFDKQQLSKMPFLKVLHLYDTDDFCFDDTSSFFNQLRVLDLGFTDIAARTLTAIQNHGFNLKELYICGIDLCDGDLTFNNSVFPHLQTICLSYTYVTCEGVVYLIQSCPSLKNVNVDEDVAESFAAHPFAVANRCKSGIVKAISYCHKHNVDNLYN